MKLPGMISPASGGTIDNVDKRAATAVRRLWRKMEMNIVERRRGSRYRMSLEKRKDPMTKLRIEVPDLLHLHGWDKGCPDTPRPAYTVLPSGQ